MLKTIFEGGIGNIGYNLKGYQEKKDAFQATAASPVVDTTGAISKPETRSFIHGIGHMMIGMSMLMVYIQMEV